MIGHPRRALFPAWSIHCLGPPETPWGFVIPAPIPGCRLDLARLRREVGQKDMAEKKKAFDLSSACSLTSGPLGPVLLSSIPSLGRRRPVSQSSRVCELLVWFSVGAKIIAQDQEFISSLV
jgi:hypothetical protein